jgi:hypothetical protein
MSCSANVWTTLIVRSLSFVGIVHDSYRSVGWDDDCPGLTVTLAREEEWKRQEDHNNKEAAD